MTTKLQKAAEELANTAADVLADICDQDTGWFYHLGSRIEAVHRLLRIEKAQGLGPEPSPTWDHRQAPIKE